ncbi:MAG: SPASM domain-containing protein, partial [Myxococcota bacterium]
LARRVGADAMLGARVFTRRDGDLAPTALRPSPEALAQVLRDPRVYGAERSLPPPVEPDAIPCGIGRRGCRVGPDGSVYGCAVHPEPVGNLRERRFADIWWGDSPVLARLRAIRNRDLGPACTACTKSGYCQRCLALGELEHGDWRAPVEDACRTARAHDIAAGMAEAKLPPGLAGPVHLRSLPIVSNLR